MEFCIVCSQTPSDLINIEQTDSNQLKLIEKLKLCVQEVEWGKEASICDPCTSLLDTAYNFRELCLRSDSARKLKQEYDCKGDFALISDNEQESNANVDYKCQMCTRSFESRKLLTVHNRDVHRMTKPYNCLGCDNNFKTHSELLEHEKMHAFKCDECGEEFKTSASLKTHKVVHAKTLLETHKLQNDVKVVMVVCFDCNEKFDSKPALISHIFEKHQTVRSDSDSKKLKAAEHSCHVCGNVFGTPYLLKRHLQNVHATEKKYHCDDCDQKFVSRVYLNAHKRYHSGKRTHMCSFCGKGFITGSDLYHHEKIHKNQRAYKCERCPKAFNTSSDLHKHKLCVHQDRNEWKYICCYCDRRFPLKTNLDAHLKTHTGEKNFACHLCERRCVNKSVLMRHIGSHSNVRLYKCSTCHSEYKYQKSLDIHLARAHGIGDARIPQRTKKYFCHICPKAYFANNKLQKHIRTHTGERPFACHVCDKRFIDKSYVRQHLKTSHSDVWHENYTE